MATTTTSDTADNHAPHQVSDIAPFRWHVISNIAMKLGWEWTQESNTVDRFSRDGVVLTVSWTERAVKAATGTNGLNILPREAAKLQKLCRALGADIRDDQKFASLPVGNIAKLPNKDRLARDARAGLRIVAEPTLSTAVAGVSLTADTGGVAADTVQEEIVDSSSPERTNWNFAPGEENTPTGYAMTDVEQPIDFAGAADVPAVTAVSVDAVPEAVITAERAEFERAASGQAEQKEAALTARFREYLEKSHGRKVKRYKITTPTGLLFTDTADVTAGVLYEAKGTAERMSVRLALGQVLDYGRYVDRYVEGAQLAILLPSPPAADLVELLESHNVGCVVEGELGHFSDMTGLGRCP
ncbi:hypothetical protein [Mycobacterium sp. 852014-52144_SCH5372336]|uniref:hypothetical protein n=1 Tax=Mycobacterium sp. 852014-52144_SCH5372336 TaxID=1834115 RepID=UPI0007FF54A1|nr:hypothetical protein [Mycobacterium sp. 852014-52144_SCH5372336]OBB73215.1 hypothetical protein A5759_16600 [Mycobacterium sp. 852014-52144_SCH5372336]